MRLYNGDCLEVLKKLPDNSIDLIITDPPYLFDSNGRGGAFGSEKRRYHKEYAQVSIIKNNSRLDRLKAQQRSDIGEELANSFNPQILDEMCRVMKKINMYIWCSKSQWRMIIDYFSDKKCFIDLIVWHKTNPIPTCNGTYLNDTEYCFFIREKGVKVYGNYHTKKKYYISNTNKADKDKYNHPTIKPLNIIENFVINSSLENDVICDPFMGSGTTGVACKNLQRDFIGIEINEKYFNTAKERINERKLWDATD